MFDGARKKLLYFSRGRGRGHAVVDIQIGQELAKLRSDVQILYVSYGTGALTFREQRIPIIDLDLPDMNSIAATTVLAGRVIGRLQPDLVVANEEFPVLPAAKIFGNRTVMITDFFGEPGKFSMESLWFADHVLFLDRKNEREPPPVAGKVRYMGPQLRPFAYTRKDRQRARQELGITGTIVIGVFPGSWTEAMAPLVDRLLPALDAAKLGDVQVIWLAGQDAARIRKYTKKRSDITVLEADWQIDRLMVACNLAITKTNRITVQELASLGIRTLSVDYGLNSIGCERIAHLRANRTIAIDDLNAGVIEASLHQREPAPLQTRRQSCASALSEILCR